MAAPHLSINDFFTRLSSLFDSHRTSTHGSIYLTQKRLSHASQTASPPTTTITTATSNPPFPDLAPSSPLPILIRASNGMSKDRQKYKIKISTIVQPDDLEGFFTRYADIMKAGTPMLKKRDRSGRKKAKAKKRKGAGEVEKK
ncbi:MAG: hypothetical protein Q9220_002030 [cf. Caloplaca sp. 1 TL-2023]